MINKNYDEDSITVLKGLEGVQKRPSMYIGNIGIEGCNHMVREVLDNSIDEALNGFGNKIIVKISNKSKSCLVEDFGRGIPPKAIEKAFCTLHASGKFDNNEYSASAGTNGVGTTAVNALSKSFIVESVRDNKCYVQKFSNGAPITKLQCTGEKRNKQSGTIVTFEPNEEFMETVGFDIETIKNEISTKVYTLKGVEIILVDLDENKEYKYFSKNGIKDFISTNCKDPISNTFELSDKVDYIKNKNGNDIHYKFEFDIAFAYDKKSNGKVISFCNSLLMREGGIQETTFKTALTRFFKNYIKTNKMISKKEEYLFNKINGDNTTDGLYAIINIKHPNPIFENQTKNKLKSEEISSISKNITDKLTEFADNNPKEIKVICQKIIVNTKAAESARKAKENITKKAMNQFSVVSDLSKLANCISTDTSENEIFITEGKSASGTAKEARDNKFQAVYSLRGKMLNTVGLDTNRVLSNKECADLAFILTGFKNGIDDNFKIENLKYGKVIMLCDADVDGYHIVNLGITYFFCHMLELVLQGHLFVAIPPLYSIIEKGKKRYFIDQEDYDNYIYEKLLNKYNFIDCDENIIDNIKDLNKVFNDYQNLVDYISDLASNNIGLSKDLILDLYDYMTNQQEFKTSAVVKFFTEECEDIIANDNHYEGFYKNSYISFIINDIIEIINKIIIYCNNNLKSSNRSYGNIYFNENNEEVFEFLGLNDFHSLIINNTPKSRVRLKGLGEMSADELRSTTLDSSVRNIYKIEIKDVDEAKKSINNYMNGDSKYVDFRKNILLIKQDQE